MKKDRKWLKEALLELRGAGKPENNRTKRERELGRAQQWAWNNCIDRAYELAEQLDEPEVLSQEWIDDNSVYASSDGVTEEYVHVDDLRNLLVVHVDDLQNLLLSNQEKISSYKQIDKLANFIMSEVEDEPSQSQGVVDTAIRIIKSYQSQEMLSQDWINKHAYAVAYDGMPDDTEVVYVDDLQNLLMPEQKKLEIKIQELIEKYEKEEGKHSNPENAWIDEFITDLSRITDKEKNMKVTLLEYTPNGEALIASAAKLCYSAADVDELMEGLNEESVTKFLDKLNSLGHASPLEHVSMTFAVEGISRSLSHQLVRHRIASYSQQSQRYVDLLDFDYVTPRHIDGENYLAGLYTDTMKKLQGVYKELVDGLTENLTDDYIADGMSEEEAVKKAEKGALEDARYVLPNACTTKVIMTMNVRSLLHFLKVRGCSRAQWEIRQLAIEILKLCVATYPTLFKHAGPGCVTGPCPEGSMTCGRCKGVREYFNAMTHGDMNEEDY